MLRAPLAMRLRSTAPGQGGIESAWSKHNSNESAVPNNVDASQLSDVFKKSAEIVLGIARRDLFRHLAILAKIYRPDQMRAIRVSPPREFGRPSNGVCHHSHATAKVFYSRQPPPIGL
jgi:hypothetical protein